MNSGVWHTCKISLAQLTTIWTIILLDFTGIVIARMQQVNLCVWFHVFWQTSAVSVDDYGRDLAGIQALQRKQEDIEQDMMALFQQLQVRGSSQKFPSSTY